MTSTARWFRHAATLAALSAAGVIVVTGVAGAQTAKPAPRSPSKPGKSASAGTSAVASAARPLTGQWAGTVTVKLGDSTIVAPVFYTFVDSAGATGGSAMVPGQGTGPISNYARTGEMIRFRVTAKQAEKIRLLEHEGTLGADGALEGMVSLDSKPVAKFRIAPKK